MKKESIATPTPTLIWIEIVLKDATGAEIIGKAGMFDYEDCRRSESRQKLNVYKIKTGIEYIRSIDIDEIIRIIPQVGMGASFGAGSDSYPATIVKVSENKKIIWVTPDESTATKDSSYYDLQNYTYKSRMNEPEEDWVCYTLRKNGRWIRKGAPIKHSWAGISLGHRRKYLDPHF